MSDNPALMQNSVNVGISGAGALEVQKFAWSRVFGFYRKHLYGIDRFKVYSPAY
jgi:hypothetical protein